MKLSFLPFWFCVFMFVLSGCVGNSVVMQTVAYDRDSLTVATAINRVAQKNQLSEKLGVADTIKTFMFETKTTLQYQVHPISKDSASLLLLTTIEGKNDDVARNINRSFHSFLSQELKPDFAANNSEKLFKPELKSRSSFLLRGLITPAWGWQYLCADNLFVSQGTKWLFIIGAGILDVGSVGLLTAKAFAKSGSSHISVSQPITFMALMRLFILMVDGSNFQNHNNVVKSGYFVPKDIE
jgi:hypothetical protein